MFIMRRSYDVGCIYMCADFVVVVGVLSHIASFRVLMTGVLWYRKFVCVCGACRYCVTERYHEPADAAVVMVYI